nr:hypothetical protein [Tanacetum cinerariifolium]
MESNEIIKSGVEELLPIPSECEVTSEDESKCDMLIQDQSSSVFMTFSNPLFKYNDDLTSSDDESLSEDDVTIKESKVYSNPPFDDDEINSDELKSHDNDSQREEIDIVTNMDDVLPQGFEKDDDSKGEVDAVEELHVDNSISNAENELSDNGASDFDNPSFPRPPPEPPDDEFDFELDTGDEILVMINTIDEFES